MQSNEDHSGLFPFVLGMIVLIFTGVGLSIIVEQRLEFSRHEFLLGKEIHAGDEELEGLKKIHRVLSRELVSAEPKQRSQKSALEALQSRNRLLKQHLVSLNGQRDELTKSIPLIMEEFSNYRQKYCETIRNAAVGEFLGTLTTLGGREYHKAFITGVTDIGLEIRHEHGYARLSSSDLDSALQDRFQWGDRARQIRLGE